MAGEQIRVDAELTVRAQIEARAEHPGFADRIFLRQDGRQWTYRRFRDESVRMAHFLLGRLQPIDDQRPGHVAMLLENHLELVSVFGGCAYAKLLLFGVNTGLRGDVLAGVLNHSRARVLIVDQRLQAEVERVQSKLVHIEPKNILVLPTTGAPIAESSDLLRRLEDEIGPATVRREAPDVEVAPTDNLMVIYTSGTTGLPKGINNNNFKLVVTGMAVAGNLGLGNEDVGYACMPLYHSNAMFVALLPIMFAGGSIGLRERFSSSRFLDDIRQYRSTFWNYVGEPVHYVLSALEQRFGKDPERIRASLAADPDVRLRFCVGNGAAAPDIDRMTSYFELEDMFELYGSTEAAISTFRTKGNPRGSVGEIRDPAVKILDPAGNECPPAELGPDGRTVLNYEEAVGEICRVAPDTSLFQGYFDNDGANRDKYRNGIYHSGDLGHVVEQDGHRYLFFDGRTADWIRKDGENFSASQVGRLIGDNPDVALAVAYGVPCPVSDEWVMTAVKLRQGVEFRPKDFFLWCEAQVNGGSMDRKWMPDFVRVVQDFQYTETQKVLVRQLKSEHFNRTKLPAEPIYWRERGDVEFKPLTPEDYQRLRQEFAAQERLALLDR